MPPVPFWVLRRLAYALLGFAALGTFAYVELDEAGGLDDWQIIGLAVIVGLCGPTEVAARAIGSWMNTLTFEERLDLEEPAKACLVGLSDQTERPITQIPILEIGVTVFVVRRSLFHLKRGFQSRQVRVRLESTPLPTQITWTWKKGVLGECWEQRRDAELDHPTHFADYMHCTKKEWENAVPDQVKRNLTYDDYVHVRDYGYIRAVPMISTRDGRYRGCMVVQVPSHQAPQLCTPDAIEFMHLSARLVCAALK